MFKSTMIVKECKPAIGLSWFYSLNFFFKVGLDFSQTTSTKSLSYSLADHLWFGRFFDQSVWFFSLSCSPLLAIENTPKRHKSQGTRSSLPTSTTINCTCFKRTTSSLELEGQFQVPSLYRKSQTLAWREIFTYNITTVLKCSTISSHKGSN